MKVKFFEHQFSKLYQIVIFTTGIYAVSRYKKLYLLAVVFPECRMRSGGKAF